MTDNKFDAMPANPFGDMDISAEVDDRVGNEMLGTLAIDDDHIASFVSAQGPTFPALLPDGLSVTVVITEGVASVTSVVIDAVTEAAVTEQAVTDTAIDMIDEHMGDLAKWLVKNMPGEIKRMSPSESMVDLVIRLLAAGMPKTETFNRGTKALMEAQEAKQRRARGG